MTVSAGLYALCEFEQPLPSHNRTHPMLVHVASTKDKLTVQQIVSKFNVGSHEVYDFRSQVRNQNALANFMKLETRGKREMNTAVRECVGVVCVCERLKTMQITGTC